MHVAKRRTARPRPMRQVFSVGKPRPARSGGRKAWHGEQWKARGKRIGSGNWGLEVAGSGMKESSSKRLAPLQEVEASTGAAFTVG